MPTVYTARSEIEERLNALENQQVTLYAPIFAPGAEIGIFGRLTQADNGRWRVVLFSDKQAAALLFPVTTIERVVYPTAGEDVDLRGQIHLRSMPQQRGLYQEFM